MAGWLVGYTFLRQTFPAGMNVELVVGAGHFLQLERPERVIDLVVQHLNAYTK